MVDENLEEPSLLDPDGNVDIQFNWQEEFQRHIISLILLDRQFMLQAIDLVKPKYFTQRAHQMACLIAFEFFNRYGLLPDKAFLVQELRDRLKGNKSLPYYLGEINVVYDYFQPGLESREYLTDKIHYFAKIMSVKAAFDETVKLVKKGSESEETWGKIHELWKSALLVERNFDVGIDYFKTLQERYSEESEEEDRNSRFITGFPTMDEETGGGYSAGEIMAVVANSGVGKCFGKGTPILMYDGTIKNIQDIQVGDLVMGNDSTPRKVLRLVRGQDKLYDVIPTKGMRYRVNSEHVLSLKGLRNNIVNVPIKTYLKQHNTFKINHKGYRVGVKFPKQPVRIDPYILGTWLGDGTVRTTEITSMDKDVVAEWELYAWKRNMTLTKKKGAKGRAYTYGIVGSQGKTNPLKSDLRFYNLILNKHIPHVYKVNSRKVRLEVLAGVIDADGSISNNCCDFINKNRILANDVVYLARSLGFAAYVKPSRKKSQNGTYGNYWRVTISGNTSQIPVRIARKKCHKRQQIKDVLKTGIKVVPAGIGNYYGFETDGNHLFLLGDFTVVHNSVYLACFAAMNIMRRKKGVYISCELLDKKVAARMDAIFTGLPIKALKSYKEDVFTKIEAMRDGRVFVKNESDKRWFDGTLGMGGNASIVADEDFSPLIIKEFPGRTLTVDMIRAYIAQLRFRGFNPDFIIVDYLGEMKDIPGLEIYESRERIVGHLRGMAKEEKVFVAIALQPNRKGKEAGKMDNGVIDEEHFADSYGQIRVLDGAFSFMQNDKEKTMGVGRGFVIKQRDGKSRYYFNLAFDKENLRITEISNAKYKEAMVKFKDKVIENVDVDNIKDIDAQMAEEEAARESQKKKMAEREKGTKLG
jgi:hypothetical protein